MSFLSGLFGAGKLFSNILGGGAGSSSNESASNVQDSTTTQNQDSKTRQSISEQIRGTNAEAGQNSNAQLSENEQSTLQFSEGFLKLLESSSVAALSRNNAGGDAASARLKQITTPSGDFDENQYISSVMRAADNTINRSMLSDSNKIMSVTGGSATGNSQAALLVNKLKTDGAAQLAGIRGDATARAAEIKRLDRSTKSNEIMGLIGSMDNGLASVLAALKGGETASSGQDQVAQRSANSKVAENRQASANNTFNENIMSSLSDTNSTSNTTGTKKTPFNWATGIGNIFKDVGI